MKTESWGVTWQAKHFEEKMEPMHTPPHCSRQSAVVTQANDITCVDIALFNGSALPKVAISGITLITAALEPTPSGSAANVFATTRRYERTSSTSWYGIRSWNCSGIPID
ncbi:hypothetical protein R69927_07722 [Paraburkholderia domus]|nr:hypothetical protein R69927_07722 [Paraburkholderia domus]